MCFIAYFEFWIQVPLKQKNKQSQKVNLEGTYFQKELNKCSRVFLLIYYIEK